MKKSQKGFDTIIKSFNEKREAFLRIDQIKTGDILEKQTPSYTKILKDQEILKRIGNYI